MADHKSITAAGVHVIGYMQTTDPGTIGAGKVWIDTTTTPYLLKVRNAANTGWDVQGGAVYNNGLRMAYDEGMVYYG